MVSTYERARQFVVINELLVADVNRINHPFEDHCIRVVATDGEVDGVVRGHCVLLCVTLSC